MVNVKLKQLINKLNPHCKRTLEAAAGLCLSRSHYNIEIEHWLLKLLEESNNDIALILKHFEINPTEILQELNYRLETFKTGNAQAPVLSQWLVNLIQSSWLAATVEFDEEQIRSGPLLYTLLSDQQLQLTSGNLSKTLSKISIDTLNNKLLTITQESQETEKSQTSQSTAQKTKGGALDKFTINITEQARDGKIDPVIEREHEISQIIDILSRRRQNNPILTGEPGVGKTAVVEGFALRIVNKDVPPFLRDVALHTLDLGLLQAGAGVKGEFENRLKSVIAEVKQSPHPIILFIDEAHTLVGAGAQSGQNDAANLLKPALARGELRTIAATTWAEYKKYFEQDAALARRFQVIKVEEPNEPAAINMLNGLVEKLEQHHKVRIQSDAIKEAVKLSKRYIAARQLPDKAISVLDTACARVGISQSTTPTAIEHRQHQLHNLMTQIELLSREDRISNQHGETLDQLLTDKEQLTNEISQLEERYKNEQEIIKQIDEVREKLSENDDDQSKTSEIEDLRQQFNQLQEKLIQIQQENPLIYDCVDSTTVADVIANWTGIPVGRMVNDDIHMVFNLYDALKRRIVGQDEALDNISKTLRTAKAKLADPRKPLGVFLLFGPSGVGKTETALALAEQLYGSEQQMTVINMSEFKEEHKISLLIGSPPGYVGYGEGGILTEAVRRKPYSLILLDEMEKAHPGVQELFYQVFDKGMLRDGQGQDIDFKNTVIIMTSNVASEKITKLCANPETRPDNQGLIDSIWQDLINKFKPAFLGRVNLIAYNMLDKTHLHSIIELQLNKIKERLQENYQANLIYTPQIMEHIANRSIDNETGARYIENIISQKLLPQISTIILEALTEKRQIKEVGIDINDDGEMVVGANNHSPV